MATASDSEPDARARIRGCLLGGAVGDALGADVEFIETTAEIRRRFGDAGVTDYPTRPGHITDDTQMLLFTAEGLLRAQQRAIHRGLVSITEQMRLAYLRWYVTQDQPFDVDALTPVGELGGDPTANGWLLHEPALYHRRAPGITCLTSLAAGGNGTVDEPPNESKGCGTVMRIAPIGLAREAAFDPFDRAVAASLVTHGHPSGYLAGGALALIIAELFAGRTLTAAIDLARQRLANEPGHEEVSAAVDAAIRHATDEPEPTPETIEALGAGWVAEEALGISLYCALTATDLGSALTAAVTHAGDSDSTGAIVGNLLGTAWGDAALPAHLVEGLDPDERAIVEQMAEDLWVKLHRDGGITSDSPYDARYPG